MIELFDDFVITVDENQYSVGKRYFSKSKDGTLTEKIKQIGHYTSLSQALNGFTKYLARNELKDGNRTLAEAIKTIREIADRVEKFVAENVPQGV